MDTTRPLHDVFADLAGTGEFGEPAEVLRASGHHDLPDGLVAEAVVNYADTAPVEVAEHLAPFVRAHSPIPSSDPAETAPSWLEALQTAPAAVDPGELLDEPPAGAVGDDTHLALDPSGAAGDDPAFGQGDATAAQPPTDPHGVTTADDAGAVAGYPSGDPTGLPDGPTFDAATGGLGPDAFEGDLDTDPAGLDDLDS